MEKETLAFNLFNIISKMEDADKDKVCEYLKMNMESESSNMTIDDFFRIIDRKGNKREDG